MEVSLAITGASGAQYGIRLLDVLMAQGHSVHLAVSKAAAMVINIETPEQWPGSLRAQQQWLDERYQGQKGSVKIYGENDWMSPMASGSSSADTMVVCPCSTSTLSAIATGASNNLIERAADVVLKERGNLIVVPRETPMNTIHLRHMVTLSELGVTVLPAAPGFYQLPKTIDDMIDFVVARILQAMKLEQDLLPKWGYKGSE
ncbi:flavin prenyltransferase UbiX [Salinibius halmophilus]|uniref:flavin prenyltransferase UbiX n=1 Tax=Salinibius halmophilus TaxID=1853216 RepID=UPI000E669A0D|nr:flavin prenyltransferase UbiX [Salinibius halmophilus]